MKNKRFAQSFFSENGILQGTSWLILLTAAVMLLCMLGRSSLVGLEAETADALRELLGGKDVFSATGEYNGYDIPSLWNCRIRSIPAILFGISELTCRLPSVFSALLMLCGTMLLSKDFFNRSTMYTITWMLVGSCGFIYWGRFAGNYMTLAAWAVWSAVMLRFVYDKLWWRCIFFIVVFTGIAWWGMHYLLLLPGIILIMLPHCRKVFLHWQNLIAAGIALVTVFIGLFFAVDFTGMPFWQSSARVWHLVSGTFIESLYMTLWPGIGGTLRGGNIWNLYQLLFPWSLPAAVALVSLSRKVKKLPEVHRSLFYGTILILLLTALFPARSWQYQLPLLPFLLMITGGVITGRIGEIRWVPYITRIMIWIISILCSFAVAVIVTWPLWNMVLFSPPPLSLMIFSPLLGLLGLACVVFGKGFAGTIERLSGMRGPWSGYILGGVCFMAAALAIGYPSLDIYRSGRPFWMACGNLTRHLPEEEVIFAGEEMPAAARYYMALPEPCQVVPEIQELPSALVKVSTGEARLIIRKKFLEDARKVLTRYHWELGSDRFIVEEGGVISFSGETVPGDEKFVLCKIIRK
ncbi:MAG: hypothetical protein E7058_01050 [Lentisphaerae bacterium]|nr:hypothetical protein [Lentisphaerota bacterium]